MRSSIIKYKFIFRLLISLPILFLLTLVLAGIVFDLPKDSSANSILIKQFGTIERDEGKDVVIDKQDNVYVSGATGRDLFGPHLGSFDCFLGKFDTSLVQQNAIQFGTSSLEECRFAHLALDQSDNIHYFGVTHGSLAGPNLGQSDVFILKFDPSLSQLDGAQFGSNSEDQSGKIIIDNLGNIFTSFWTFGSIFGPHAGGRDGIVAKYDSFLDPIVGLQFASSGDDAAFAVDLDKDGNLYVVGRVSGPVFGPTFGALDGFLVKYDSSLNQLQSTQFGTSGNDEVVDVAVDKLGNVYVTTIGNDPRLTKFNSSFVQQWSKPIAGAENIQIALDSFGNVYLAHAGGVDVGVVIFDSNGNQLFATQFGSAGNEFISGIALDSLNNIYVIGRTTGSLGGPNAGDFDVFLAKIPAQVSVQIEVDIDIKPGSDPNSINAGNEGVIPVAIFTTPTFDAATVDPFSITLEGGTIKLKGKSGNGGSLEDFDGDGDLDLVVQITDWTLTEGQTTAVLTGKTKDGVVIRGEDSIRVVPL